MGSTGPQLFAGGFDDASPPMSVPVEDDGNLSSGDPSSASGDEEQEDIVALSEQVAIPSLDESVPDHDGQWGTESYERTQGIDDIFEKFTLRVNEEPQQCVRCGISLSNLCLLLAQS